MRTRANVLLVAVAATSALALTLIHQSPTGVVSIGLEPAAVRAAPGQSSAAKYDLSALKIFTLTQTRVRERYVDPSRIDPQKMLFKALDSVQFAIPEVLVEPDTANNRVTVVVNDKREVFETADVDSAWRLSSRLKQIFRFMEANMNAGADLAKIEYAAVNGMLATLDPHSNLMDPEAARDMDASTSGKFGGLGIVIRMIDRKLTVVRPMKNTPAWRKGIKAGDHIVRINSEITENLTSNEAVDRMRGDPGTGVTLFVERKGQTSTLKFELERAVIRVSQVEHKLLDKNVGYIRVKQFSKGIASDVADAMREMSGQGATSWILDLRWNGGGLLSEAVQLVDLWVDSGTIVSQVSRNDRPSQRAEVGFGDTSSSLAVLVNGGSASASEIVAGALKNLDRAAIVGTRTFGKGSVQELYDNDNGSKLKITVAQYLTPGDRSIQNIGIVPDIALQRMRIPEKNDEASDYVRMLPPTKSYGEKDLDATLTSSYANDTDKPAYEVPFIYEKPKSATPVTSKEATPAPVDDDEEPIEDEIIEDFEMRIAKNLVSSVNSATRTGLVKAAAATITRTRVEQDKKLIDALAKINVNWTATAAVGATTLEGSLSANTTAAKAGETLAVTATVKNTGPTAASRVLARIHADDYSFDDMELPIGAIAPGETKTFTTKIKLPKDALSRVDRLTLEVREAKNAKATTQPFEIAITETPRPVFAYSYQLVDDGNGDGLVQKGEKFRLQVTIKNTGLGASDEASAILRNASGDGVLLDKSRFEIGVLAPGQSRELAFPVSITNALHGDKLILELIAYDAALDSQASDKLKFDIAPALVLQPGKGSAVIRSKSAQLFAGAAANTTVIGTASKGASFPVLGTAGGFSKINLGNNRIGFVANADVAAGSGGLGMFTAAWNSTPPAIALSLPTLKVAVANYTLNGTVSDDSHVEDVYIFVSNNSAKIDSRKVFYRSNRGGKTEGKLDFSAAVPLWPGANQITIIARENQEVRSTKTINILRDATATAATVRPAAASPTVMPATAPVTSPGGRAAVAPPKAAPTTK